MSYSIALDIGATKTLGGIIKNNHVLKKIKHPTQAKASKEIILQGIKKIIKELITQPEAENDVLKKIGIGFAGQIDQKNGVLLGTGNFNKNFKNIKLGEILTREFKIKTVIDNDVHCFVLGESQLGAGVGIKNLVGLTFGTGIGGGILNQGVLWRGKNNTAGEVGSMKIAGQWIGPAPICGCGQKYCFESMASGSAWHKINKKHGAKKADQIIIYNIVTGLNNLCQILNPEMFILGGGLMEHPSLLKKIKNEFLTRAEKTWFRQVKIVLPKLGDEAILLGSLMN